MKLLTPEFGLLIWTLLAFLIVFFILKKLAWPAIIKGLRDRENSITDSLATAQKVKEEMALMKSENEALLAKAREERALMLKQRTGSSTKQKSRLRLKQVKLLRKPRLLSMHRRWLL